MLTIRKKGNKNFWHYDSDFTQAYSASDLTIVFDGNTAKLRSITGRVVFEQTGYLFSAVTIYDDSVAGGAEVFASAVLLAQRLVDLGYSAYYVSGDIVIGDLISDDASNIIVLGDDGKLFAINGGSSPLTTKGDVFVYGSENDRLPIGANGEVIVADSSETLGVKWAALGGGGDLLAANNLNDVDNVSDARDNLGLDTTANQTDSANKRFMSDAQETILDNTSGTNTGDQDISGKQNVLSEGAFVDGDKTKLDGLSATFHLGLAFGNEVTDISVGTDKLTFQMPNFDTTLTDVSVNVKTAPTGSVATFDLNEAGTSVLSTKITIDAGKKTSVTASTPPVISESAIQANAIMTVDIDGVGSTVSGVAPKLWIYYTVPKIAPNVPNMFPFKFTVNTAESGTSGVDQFTIPVGAGTFLYNVTTEDGYSATGLTGDHTITFPTGTGIHNVEITGSFPSMKFNSSGDRNKFSTIENFGIYGINSLDQTSAFYGCSNLLVNATDIGHLENVTNFTQLFRSCGSIVSIPRFNTSSATTFAIAFFGCGQLTEFPLLDTSNVTSLNFTFTSCSSLTGFPLIDTSSVTNFSQAWFNCNSITLFPAINPISSTSFNKTWGNCAVLNTFPANIFNNSISTSNYTEAFSSTNLTEQSIDNILVSIDSNGVSNGTFEQSGGEAPSAIGLAAKDSLVAKGWTIVYTIPAIVPGTPNMLPFKFTVDTSEPGTSGVDQFTIPTGFGTFLYDVATSDGYGATGLTGAHTITFPSGAGTHTVEITGSFPAMRFISGGDKKKFSTIERFGIYGINSLSQNEAFHGCSNLLINAVDIGHLENVTDFSRFLRSCGSITTIPRFNTSSATNFDTAFLRCSSLTEFPLIDTSNVTNFSQTWFVCSSLTEFPLIDTSSGTNFSQTWFVCSSLTEFPAINLINATTFNKTWGSCSNLETFSANVFDNSISTSNYSNAFQSTNLTEQSIDNILVSIDANGVSNGTFTQSGGTTPGVIGIAAKDSLVSKGWTIVYTT